MKISKTKFVILLIILIIFIVVIARTTYSIGLHNASLTVTEATPKQLAVAMQSDNFYGEYMQTMLLITGKVKTVRQQGQDTLVVFETTNSPSVLGNVSCNLGNVKKAVKQGDAIKVLTVAHDAIRQNTADVFMPNCFLLKL